MAKPTANSHTPRLPQTTPPPANGVAAARRNHKRKPVVELYAAKLEQSLETFTHVTTFARNCHALATDPNHKLLLAQIGDASLALGTATKAVLATYVSLVDSKFVVPEAIRPTRGHGLAVGDSIKLLPEFAARYESFPLWRGCSAETLQIVHIDGGEFLAARPNGKSEIYIRSAKHVSRI
jgi:hypothetical protein